MSEWVEIIVSILSGLAVVIPVVCKLVAITMSYVKEKNWNRIISIVAEYMATAEMMFTAGSEKKAWVIEMLKTSAQISNFELTDENLLKISELIDKMCDLSKKINVPKEEEIEAES